MARRGKLIGLVLACLAGVLAVKLIGVDRFAPTSTPASSVPGATDPQARLRAPLEPGMAEPSPEESPTRSALESEELLPDPTAEVVSRIRCRIVLEGLRAGTDDVTVDVRVGGVSQPCTREGESVWVCSAAVTASDIQKRSVISASTTSSTYAWNQRTAQLSPELLEQGVIEWRFALRAGAILTVDVQSRAGRKAACGTIWLNHDWLVGTERDPSTYGTRRLKLDENGAGRLTGLEPGQWTVTFDERNWWESRLPSSVVVRGGSAEHLSLFVSETETSDYLSGVVVGRAGTDWSCVQVWLLDEAGARIEKLDFCSGRFYCSLGLGDSIAARVTNTCTGVSSEPVTLYGGRHDHSLSLAQ